jgi:hypothetical protein
VAATDASLLMAGDGSRPKDLRDVRGRAPLSDAELFGQGLSARLFALTGIIEQQ